MNQQAFDAGKDAYKNGDMQGALNLLTQAKAPGEVSGAVDHLVGNCLMRLGRYAEAAASYGDALRDASYDHVGALACNRGRAQLAAGKPQEAVASLTMAVKDEEYATPYKAYVALGNAYMRCGNIREAGVAYRNAAIDENNPDPSSSLKSLGGCFMQMGRAADAVEAYRTALDFATAQQNQNPIYCDLGLAYVAANRMSEAVSAFAQATADGTFRLEPEAQVAYDAAKRAVDAIGSGKPSDTDQFLAAAAGQTAEKVDPLDPLGQSGEFIPSPEDTGFFSISEADLIAAEKKERKKRKKKHRGLKVFLFILFLLLVLAGVGGYGYYKGYGFPTQQATVEGLFEASATGGDVDSYFSSSISASDLAQAKAVLPTGGVSSIDGVDMSMEKSTVVCTAALSDGGTQTYHIEMVRDGIGFKVTSVTPDYASQDSTAPSVGGSTDGSSTTTGTISSSN